MSVSVLTIGLDSKRVSAALESAPRKTGIGLLRALKRGTKSARTMAGRVVAKDMGLKVGDVRRAIGLKEPTARTLTGELSASFKRIPLIKFRGRGGYRKKRAFIAKMPTGHEGIFKRVGRPRLPIYELFGPSIGYVFDKHRGEILARGEDVVITELNRQIDRIFGASGA